MAMASSRRSVAARQQLLLRVARRLAARAVLLVVVDLVVGAVDDGDRTADLGRVPMATTGVIQCNSD
jgi:hypothetical protein